MGLALPSHSDTFLNYLTNYRIWRGMVNQLVQKSKCIFRYGVIVSINREIIVIDQAVIGYCRFLGDPSE